MAFGNYGYNPYVNPYANPYQSQMQIPAQPQVQTGGGGFVWVDGIEEASNFYVAPNNAVQLWDKNSPCIYKKSADSTGKPTMQIFDLVERKTELTKPPVYGTDDFIRRNEFTQLEERVSALEARKTTKKVKDGDVDV